MKIEKLKDFVQSAHVNFLIGSGLSCPFLPTLKNIEKQLATVKNLPEEKREGVTASIYREYFEKVIAPNLIKGRPQAKYLETPYSHLRIPAHEVTANKASSVHPQVPIVVGHPR